MILQKKPKMKETRMINKIIHTQKREFSGYVTSEHYLTLFFCTQVPWYSILVFFIVRKSSCNLVDREGIEPSTSSLRTRHSTPKPPARQLSLFELSFYSFSQRIIVVRHKKF